MQRFFKYDSYMYATYVIFVYWLFQPMGGILI